MPSPRQQTHLLSARLTVPNERARAIAEIARVAALDLPLARVADELGISERTLHRWRCEDAELRAAIESARGRVRA